MQAIDEQIDSKYVDVKMACQIMGVSRTTLTNYSRSGRLKRYEQGAPIRVMYDRHQLETLKRVKPKYQ